MDGRLSWPCWLTGSGRRNHKAVTRPASSLAQDRESSPPETSVLPTVPHAANWILHRDGSISRWPFRHRSCCYLLQADCVFIGVCRFFCYQDYAKNCSTDIHKMRWKRLPYGPRKKRSDFGGNPDHVMLRLGQG